MEPSATWQFPSIKVHDWGIISKKRCHFRGFITDEIAFRETEGFCLLTDSLDGKNDSFWNVLEESDTEKQLFRS